jgi:glycosyltransferase involved in cell wall biosynthesis
MACGTPAVVSAIAPFTEYLGDDDCVWVDPQSVPAIAVGMVRACDRAHAARLRVAGFAVSRRFTWAASAARHLAIYRAVATARQPEHSHA